MSSRRERLADFQHGRAPELAALVEDQAAAAREALLERRRAEAARRAALIEADVVQARAGVIVAETVRALAAAAGLPKRPVCQWCRRTMNTGCRTCTYCGQGTRDRRGLPRPVAPAGGWPGAPGSAETRAA